MTASLLAGCGTTQEQTNVSDDMTVNDIVSVDTITNPNGSQEPMVGQPQDLNDVAVSADWLKTFNQSNSDWNLAFQYPADYRVSMENKTIKLTNEAGELIYRFDAGTCDPVEEVPWVIEKVTLNNNTFFKFTQEKQYFYFLDAPTTNSCIIFNGSSASSEKEKTNFEILMLSVQFL